MATKTTKEKKIKEVAETKDVKKNSLVLGPRVTEKSAVHAERGAYTFNVAESANKSQIKKAIKALYNVVPMKVNITQITKKDGPSPWYYWYQERWQEGDCVFKKGR
jgi:ribosomal protein L23